MKFRDQFNAVMSIVNLLLVIAGLAWALYYAFVVHDLLGVNTTVVDQPDYNTPAIGEVAGTRSSVPASNVPFAILKLENGTATSANEPEPAQVVVPTAPVEPQRDIASVRTDLHFSGIDMDSVVLNYMTHRGGEVLSSELMMDDARTIVYMMPNIPNHINIPTLVVETAMTETHLGAASYDYAAKNWNNYGLLQIRRDTAEDTLKWLKRVRPDAYAVVMRFYDKDRSMTDNLMYNVPFSIAVAVQYYWRRCPRLLEAVNNVNDRANLWKRVYNTPAGAGTPEHYIARVASFSA